jgi:hypothetical protein
MIGPDPGAHALLSRLGQIPQRWAMFLTSLFGSNRFAARAKTRKHAIPGAIST